MTNYNVHFVLILLMIYTSQLIGVKGSEQKRFYIVFLGDRPVNIEGHSIAQSHVHVLSSVKGSNVEAQEAIVYSYTKSFNAFAAKLSSDEANKLSQMNEVASVIPNGYRKLHTTRSWDFLGFPLTSRRRLKAESNITVGLLDTGITLDSESFKDDGFGPPPKKWKGTCVTSVNFTSCNNKIIGARYYKLDGNPDPSDILSPLDVDGHGTHTSSTLAGAEVRNASLFGLAQGTSRGAVPSARVAMYKVCWVSSGCADMDILAAFDDAINDGVDVISVSIGGGSMDYTTDSIAVGAFHAMQKGIITVASAGNDGPSLGSVANHAPWLVTVAATGLNRSFMSQIQFGNGNSILGIGISTFDVKNKLYPLVNGGDIPQNSATKAEARFCYRDSLDPIKVKGKIVLCELGNWGTESVIKEIGGVGTILQSTQFLDTAQVFMAPTTMVNYTTGDIITDYINSTRTPRAVIHKSQEVKISAPFIASFSSRGPSSGSTRVLKPDISAPGIDILAAYTPLKSLTGLSGDTQFSKFTIMSGTSMACPHIAGVAAYVKSFRPNWSPAAIRSAIMTTARPMSRRVNTEGEFAYGAGQVNPRRALNPGLVYDMNETSYIKFLCLEGYEDAKIAALIRAKSINCSILINPIRLGHDALNYPSFQLILKPRITKDIVAVYRRAVTNVGPARSVYNVTVRAPRGVSVTVTPSTLSFTRALQRRSFKVVVVARWAPSLEGQMLSGSILWMSFRHVVRSPIVVNIPFEDDGDRPHVVEVNNSNGDHDHDQIVL